MSIGLGGNKSSGSSSSSQNTSQYGTQTPNNLPYLQAGWNSAGALLNQTGQAPQLVNQAIDLFGSQTPAATAAANAGATSLTNFANGSNGPNSANQYLTPTASGAYVNSSNPEFQGVVNQISQALQPQIDGNFAAAGRYGSGANANAFASALTNETGNLAYQNYTQQQQNQLNAASQLSNNNATTAQQQIQAASGLPAAAQSLFTAPSTLGTAAFSPLLAYIAAVSSGNPGGSYSQNGTSNTMGSFSGSQLNYGAGIGGH